MSKIENIPEVVRLDGDSVFALSIARTWLDVFPSTLRKFARLNPHRLRYAMASGEISNYGLLSAAYIGVAPVPSTYGRFITHAERTNKGRSAPESTAFLTDAMAREKSAAGQFGMSRGEFKRLLARLDELASRCAGVASYDDLVNCGKEVYRDQSSFAPEDRDTYAKGPLHLWDFAKTVNEMKPADMFFDTFSGWVLFVHLENGVVFGNAIHPRAHRFGNFAHDPVIDVFRLKLADEISTMIAVPQGVQHAVQTLADSHFPNLPFEFVSPPLAGGGVVFLPKIHPDRRRWTEV
jgi:hypothetical protein